MARPFSLGVRERVGAQVMVGDTVRSVAKTFGVSEASVVARLEPSPRVTCCQSAAWTLENPHIHWRGFGTIGSRLPASSTGPSTAWPGDKPSEQSVKALLPAALQHRSRPYRTGLRQAQTRHAQSPRAKPRGHKEARRGSCERQRKRRMRAHISSAPDTLQQKTIRLQPPNQR